MKNKALFLFLLMTSFSVPSHGKVMDVEAHILKAATEQVAKECASCKVQLRVLNKASIDDIAIPDEIHSDHWKGQTNLVLKVGGETRIITADIRWVDQVVVAKKNIKQGQLIGDQDLRVVEKDVTFLKTAYAQSPKQVTGFIVKRVFQRGQIIDEGMLKKPLAIRYGQPVNLEIQEGALSVVITAKARGAGAIGDQIPVFIPKTRKKVFAKIINQSLVRVE